MAPKCFMLVQPAKGPSKRSSCSDNPRCTSYREPLARLATHCGSDRGVQRDVARARAGVCPRSCDDGRSAKTRLATRLHSEAGRTRGNPACHAALSGRLKTSQPLPSVFPALDLADSEVPLDASVFPAFESARLLGFPPLLAIVFTSFHAKAGLPESADTEQPDGRPEHRVPERGGMSRLSAAVLIDVPLYPWQGAALQQQMEQG